MVCMAKRTQLERAMQDAGVTGKDVAAALGISESRFSQILNGAPMKEAQMKCVCELLNICADVILFNYETRPRTALEEEFIILFRSKLNRRGQTRLVQLMRELGED